ncbi:hypothetical protein BJV77DRAFT_1103324 [Russula vinacea]|nr:hypothetical protein BJV77DRAFT_1103324 [Russula vinacea]
MWMLTMPHSVWCLRASQTLPTIALSYRDFRSWPSNGVQPMDGGEATGRNCYQGLMTTAPQEVSLAGSLPPATSRLLPHPHPPHRRNLLVENW